MNPQLQKALDYIRNTGGSPTLAQFDEDHEPIGPKLREQLKDAQLVFEREGKIRPAVERCPHPVKSGEACNHRGCLNHVSHPCDGCGRTAGQGDYDPKRGGSFLR